MGDIALKDTLNGGEIILDESLSATFQPQADLVLDNGLFTSVYLSLFSGLVNEIWFNEYESQNLDFQYGGELQTLINSGVTLTESTLIDIENAAKNDLQWLLNQNIASQIEVSAVFSIEGRNKIEVNIDIARFEDQENFNFTINWDAEITNVGG